MIRCTKKRKNFVKKKKPRKNQKPSKEIESYKSIGGLAVEQLQPQFLFQLLNLAAQGRL